MRIRSVLSSVGLASPEQDQRVRSNLLTRDLHVRAETLNEEARTVEAVVATENMALSLSLRDYSLVLEVYLADGFVQPKTKQVPMLDNHMRYSTETIRGSVRDLKVRGRDVVGTLHFGQGEKAENDWMNVRDGHLTDVSGGFRPLKTVEIMPGKSKSIKGRTYTAPEDRKLYVHTRWSLGEVSLTPIGADEDAKIRELPQGQTTAVSQEIVIMNEHLRAYLESLGLAADASDADAQKFYQKLTGSQRSIADALHTRAATDDGEPAGQQQAPKKPAATPATHTRSQQTDDAGGAPVNGGKDNDGPVDVNRVRSEAIAAERERVRAIQALDPAGQYPDLIRGYIDDSNMTPESAALGILTHERSLRVPATGGAPAAHTRQQSADEMRRAVAAAVSLRSGVRMERLTVRGAADPAKAREQAANQSERYADMSLVDLCRTCLEIEGRSIPHNRGEAIRAAMSTSSFSNIFTDSVNATVDQNFMDAPDSTRIWCEEGEVADFKTNTDITLNKHNGMKKLARGGTAEHTESGDTAETYKIARYASQFVMDEQDIIDDNLGVLSDIANEMSDDAAQLRPRLVYALLLSNPTMAEDGVALFHSASHGNLATDALSITAIESGTVAMAKQTKNDRNLNLKPRFLLCAQDLVPSAKVMTQSPNVVIAGTAGSVTTRGEMNSVFEDNLVVVGDNYLGLAGVTDPDSGTAYAGASTRWYLAGQRRTIKVVYRRGTNRRPEVRRFILDKGQWGIGFDINLDIGVYARDYRALYVGNNS